MPGMTAGHWASACVDEVTRTTYGMKQRYCSGSGSAAATGLHRSAGRDDHGSSGHHQSARTIGPAVTGGCWRGTIVRRYDPAVQPSNVVMVGAIALLSAACSTQAAGSGPQPAGPHPSTSAKMVCAPGAREKLDQVLGSTSTTVTRPTWVAHLYSCGYVYPQGTMTLSVKELSSTAETTSYFDGLARRYGTRQPLYGLGQGAFLADDGSVVVRKDYKVLLVDTSGFSKAYVQPESASGTPAETVASTIMDCWSGH